MLNTASFFIWNHIYFQAVLLDSYAQQARQRRGKLQGKTSYICMLQTYAARVSAAHVDSCSAVYLHRTSFCAIFHTEKKTSSAANIFQSLENLSVTFRNWWVISVNELKDVCYLAKNVSIYYDY